MRISTIKTKRFIHVTEWVDVAIRDTSVYHIVYRQKWAPLFVWSIRNLEYSVEKKAREKPDTKTTIAENYHNFWNVFSKKNFNTLFSYKKYYQKIIFDEE